MCYREDWFYGWTESDAARRRAKTAVEPKRVIPPPARTEPRADEARKPGRRHEAAPEELV